MKLRKNLNINCAECSVGALCLHKNLSSNTLDLLDTRIQHAKSLAPNEHLYLQGDKVTHIYAVYSGVCKDYRIDENGNEYVNEFYFPADILGLEFVDQGIFQLNAVAIKPTVLCVIPVSLITNHETSELSTRFFNILCQQIDNYRYHAKQTSVKHRIAAFLINLIRRSKERMSAEESEGASISIPMSYIDISNKIGISNETFSRTLKDFMDNNLFQIKQNSMINIDEEGLQKILQD